MLSHAGCAPWRGSAARSLMGSQVKSHLIKSAFVRAGMMAAAAFAQGRPGGEQRVRRQGGQCPGRLHHHRRADRRHRAFLDRARAAGEDCREAPAPAKRRDTRPVPALARVRRTSVADRLAVGVFEARPAQARLRSRQARGLLRRTRSRGQRQSGRIVGAGGTRAPSAGAGATRETRRSARGHEGSS